MKKLIYVFLLVLCFPTMVSAQTSLDETIEQIIEWKKQEQGLNVQSPLLQNPFLNHAGTTAGDWYPFALGRLGYTDDYDAYLAVIEKNIQARYEQDGLLDVTKATEWHRISLAILALGGDPTNIGGIDLIADGTYNRAHIAPLDLQGINGLIWGLIALDSMRYEVPENAATTRKNIIEGILAAQLPDGGFSFYHDTSDADITAMALQALAPYANSFEIFNYKEQASKNTVVKTVRQVIEEALATLSTLQLENGDFGSWGEPNAESTAQVLVALSALQINPLTDTRFIKNGKTILDGLMRYQQEDGGFIHSENYNPENPTSLPDESNSMANEQTLYALIAYKRFLEGYRSLYDLRPEMTTKQRQQIQQFETQLEKADLSSTTQVQQLLSQYEEIAVTEVMYIDNFAKLQQAVIDLELDYTSSTFSTEIGVTTAGNGTITPILENAIQVQISAETIESFLAQPAYTTADYNMLLRLIRFVEENEEYADYLSILQEIQEEIEAIQAEIELLNEEILQNLYPISSITLADRKIVEQVSARFKKLSDTDQQQIVNYEDLQQIEAIIASLKRELWIKRGLFLLSIGLIGLLGWRIWRKRRGEQA